MNHLLEMSNVPKFKIDLMVGLCASIEHIIVSCNNQHFRCPPKTIENWSQEFIDLKPNASKNHATSTDIKCHTQKHVIEEDKFN
jgi:hypothetical protein